MRQPIESRKTLAAYVYGQHWLRLAEQVTLQDGSVTVRNVVSLPLALERVPKHLTAEQLAAVHAKAVASAGVAPTVGEIESLSQSVAIGQRLRNAKVEA